MIFKRMVPQMHSTLQDETTPYTLKDSVQSKIALKSFGIFNTQGKLPRLGLLYLFPN